MTEEDSDYLLSGSGAEEHTESLHPSSNGSNSPVVKNMTLDQQPFTQSYSQTLTANNYPVSDFLPHSPSILNTEKGQMDLLEENLHLKAHIYALEWEHDMYRGQAEAYHAHCDLSQLENERLHREMEEKKKRNLKHKLNVSVMF